MIRILVGSIEEVDYLLEHDLKREIKFYIEEPTIDIGFSCQISGNDHSQQESGGYDLLFDCTNL